MKYQIPPKEILEWADAPLPPISSINSRGTHMIFIERSRYMALEDLYQPEMKLAGIRIHPQHLMQSKSVLYSHLRLHKVGDINALPIRGLPATQKIHQIQWSKDESRMGFSMLEENRLRLWCIDVKKQEGYRVSDIVLNATLTAPFLWHPDNHSMIALTRTPYADDLRNTAEVIPEGPVISTGHKTISQHRTYQDLLKNPVDEWNFSHLCYSKVVRIGLEGQIENIDEGLISRMSLSPDGNYLLVKKIKKPFSYHLPYNRFPFDIVLIRLDSGEKTILEEVPLQDNIPQGFMAVHTGKRNIAWRSDQPATLTFYQALDQGDPAREVAHRDAVYQWSAPFDMEVSPPVEILRTVNRMGQIQFSPFGYGIANDYWYDNHNTKTYLFYPDQPQKEVRILFDLNAQDMYGDPGSFVTQRNEFGQRVLAGDDTHAFLTGPGFRPDGIHPFLDRYDLISGEIERIWQAENKDELVQLAKIIDLDKGELVIRRETAKEFPNYYLIQWDQPEQRVPITDFENPFKGMDEIRKKIIKYERKDGIQLQAVLYLPAEDIIEEKLPLLMWAYPEEYSNRDVAGQNRMSTHEFIYPWSGSPIFWVRRGFAILDDVSFPIVAPEDGKSNDTFIEQLKDNAEAAIDAVCSRYPVDRKRIAVGGHSYGAFMTANLLTWTDFFVAGIARSGAYNRSLTPFGFQGEQRTLWEVPDLYNTMSPFLHADRMKTPLLLIHGQVDNNSGTHTMQSQRYFDALKSLGAEVRLVLLPGESHHYQSRESVMHVLWEQDRWLGKV